MTLATLLPSGQFYKNGLKQPTATRVNVNIHKAVSMISTISHPFAVAAALGPATHHLWFKHGEQDFYSRYYVVGLVSLECLGYWALSDIYGPETTRFLAKLTASYLGGLFASIFVYRAFFHPLRDFPGPFAWKVTKFAQVIANNDCHGWKHIHKLHEEYGQFVRTGASMMTSPLSMLMTRP